MDYYCEKLAPGFLDMVKKYRYDSDTPFEKSTDECNLRTIKFLESSRDSEDFMSVLNAIFDCFEELIRSDEGNLKEVLELYYDNADQYFEYTEFHYSRFSSSGDYFLCFDPFILYLCGKYFDSLKEDEKAKKSYLYSLFPLIYGDSCKSIPEEFEKHFKLILQCGYADWTCTFPRLSCVIGEYFLSKEKYDDALSYFGFGAELDYDGRQTVYPFFYVGKNQYRLGEMYYKGLGCERNIDDALDLFGYAADNFGRDGLPVMGDIYYEGDGIEKDPEKALFCYGQYNPYYGYHEDYFDLNGKQKRRCRLLIKLYYENAQSFEDKKYALNVYNNVLKDKTKATEIHSQIIRDIENIPAGKRTYEMDKMYVEQRLKDVKEELTTPSEPIGNIPKQLIINDTFTFGQFLGEPIEWKVLDIDESKNTAFVISTKILAKMTYNEISSWLNEDFLNSTFTKKQKSKIYSWEDAGFYNKGEFRVYIATTNQFEEYEGTYSAGTVKETEFAKSLCQTKEVWAVNNHVMNENGSTSDIISYDGIYGIRPAMDIYLANLKSEIPVQK